MVAAGDERGEEGNGIGQDPARGQDPVWEKNRGDGSGRALGERGGGARAPARPLETTLLGRFGENKMEFRVEK